MKFAKLTKGELIHILDTFKAISDADEPEDYSDALWEGIEVVEAHLEMLEMGDDEEIV